MRDPRGLGWRDLRRRPLRTALTTVGIAIGVALVFASLSLDAAASSGAASYAQEISGRVDLTVRAFGEGTLSPASLAAVSGTPGVLQSSPQIRRPTFASDQSRLLGPVTLVGVDPAADRALHDEVLTSGTALSSYDSAGVLLAATWAKDHGLAVGSRINLVGGGGEHTFIVRGLLAGSGPVLADAGRLAYVTIDAARSLFAVGAGAADLVEVQVDPAVGVAVVETRLETRLTTQPYLLSTAADEAAALGGATRDVGSGLLLVAAVVLFVGGLLVADALAMSVAERTREVGLLRSAGATRGQVHAMVLEGALWLGVGGAVLGIALGSLAAMALAAAVRSLTGAPIGNIILDPAALGIAIMLGLLVTLAAALEPAWRAGRVPPVEALRRGPALMALAPRLRRLAVAGAALVGMAALVAGGWAAPGGPGTRGSPSGTLGAQELAAVAGALGMLVLLLVSGFVAPVALRVAGGLVALVTLPIRRLVRAELRLARGSVSHDPGRVAVTFAALTMGLALVVGLAGVAEGTRRAGDAWLSEVAPAALAVEAISPVPVDFAGDLGAVPGVRSVTPIRLFDVAIAGRQASAMAVDPRAYDALEALTVEGGNRQAAFAALQAGGAVLVPRSVAGRFGLQAGDLLELRTAQGAAQLRVAAVIAHSLPGSTGESVVVSQADAVRSLGITGASMFLVAAAPGAAPGLDARLSAVAGQYAMSVVSPAAVGGAVTGALDRTFGLLDLLALAAVLVADLCILDMLAMDVARRVGELGILRAAGLTRGQAWRAVVAEAGILGLAGALLGIVVGVVVSIAVLVLGGTSGIRSALEVPWSAVVLALVLGVGGSMLAAAYPARLASRVEIARALRAE